MSKVKILISAPAWIGDCVMSQSLLKLLKLKYPDSAIFVLATEKVADIYRKFKEVTDVLISPFQAGDFSLMQRYKFAIDKVKDLKFDWAIILQNSWKSALIPFFAGIKKRTGYFGEARLILLNDILYEKRNKNELCHMRYLKLGMHGKIASKDVGMDLSNSFFYPSIEKPILDHDLLLNKFGIDLNKCTVVLCPGSDFGPSKRWPSEYYGKIAKDLKINNNCNVVILGHGEKDKKVGDEIQKTSENSCINLINRTSLNEVMEIIANSILAITNDTGLMHIASALDVQVIAIYGSSNPKATPPLSNKARVLYANLSCSPCYARECPLGHLDCLKKITPDRVYANALEYVSILNQIDSKA